MSNRNLNSNTHDTSTGVPFCDMPPAQRMAILARLGERFDEACKTFPVLSSLVKHDRVVIGYGDGGLTSESNKTEILFRDNQPQDITNSMASDMVQSALPNTDRLLVDIEVASEKKRILKKLLSGAIESEAWDDARTSLASLASCSRWIGALRETLNLMVSKTDA
tara:strand:- start:267 stop:761 length:495 start_codon:yes stop_codon:yes gene_type:complete